MACHPFIYFDQGLNQIQVKMSLVDSSFVGTYVVEVLGQDSFITDVMTFNVILSMPLC